MIHKLMRTFESIAIGGFIATCSDPILAHVNPGLLKTKDLIVSIHKNQSIFAINSSSARGMDSKRIFLK